MNIHRRMETPRPLLAACSLMTTVLQTTFCERLIWEQNEITLWQKCYSSFLNITHCETLPPAPRWIELTVLSIYRHLEIDSLCYLTARKLAFSVEWLHHLLACDNKNMTTQYVLGMYWGKFEKHDAHVLKYFPNWSTSFRTVCHKLPKYGILISSWWLRVFNVTTTPCFCTWVPHISSKFPIFADIPLNLNITLVDIQLSDPLSRWHLNDSVDCMLTSVVARRCNFLACLFVFVFAAYIRCVKDVSVTNSKTVTQWLKHAPVRKAQSETTANIWKFSNFLITHNVFTSATLLNCAKRS